MSEFVHLHNHTVYSLLDGACATGALVNRAKELGMTSIAITDHGCMFGVIEFYKAAMEAGIKPIIGCEVYTAKRGRMDREGKQDQEPGHLVLLAENFEGWKNIVKIVSIGYTEGFYYKPRVDKEILRKYSKGIIALSACLAGDISRSFLESDDTLAEKYAREYLEIFGEGNFFIELQYHGIEEQERVNIKLINLAKKLNIGLVLTNDVHYINKEDAKTHDALLCIQTGKTVDMENRMKFSTEEFYLKSGEEMAALFPNLPEAIKNTAAIAKRCNLKIKFGELHLPKYTLPKGVTDKKKYFYDLCLMGLKKRYEDTEPLKERMNFEISVIEKMGYVDYFLVVWDFIKYAKDNGIIVGPGRGSAAGSIVSYCLNITNVDPIKYNLLFERFLNPERISMPDIDIDFCIERRQEVIDYVVDKYGKDNVAQIITFGTMGAKQAVRDCGRVLGISYADADRVAKLIPNELKITINRALEISSELRDLYATQPAIKEMLDIAMNVEGSPRHASTHAAGVVICEESVTEYVPLSKNGDVTTTQFDMETIEKLGLLKMDFLGLRNLTVIRDTLRIIKESTGQTVNMNEISYDDKNVYQMISEGHTDGVFQLESSGMKRFMKELMPANLEDIIAGISLYRPGPMDSIPMYVRCRQTPDLVTYKHPLLKPILSVTYGCMVYQEQVMQIVRDLAGYSMGRADLVRRAMSKKKASVMNEERKNFVYGITKEDGTVELEGALRRGVDEKTANAIFDEMMDFANYAFNKSHAAAYAIVAYQTAYLKYYYTPSYMAALLSSVLGFTSKVSAYVAECSRMGIKLLPPDVNKSIQGFSAEGNSIRFGLCAVKNVGINLVNGILERRGDKPFSSFASFLERMKGAELNKRAIESLIKSGAFDCMGESRSYLLATFEGDMENLINETKKNIEGQLTLFAEEEEPLPQMKIKVPDISRQELLKMEKDMLGIYISGHPLSEYSNIIEKYVTLTTMDIAAYYETLEENPGQNLDKSFVTMAGIVMSRKNKITKSNSTMAFLEFEDLYGAVEVVVFPKTLQQYSSILTEDAHLLIRGRIDLKEDGEAKLLAETVSRLDDIKDIKEGFFYKNTEHGPAYNTEAATEEYINTEAPLLPAEKSGQKEKNLYLRFLVGKDFLMGQIEDIINKNKGGTKVVLYRQEQNDRKNLDTGINLSEETRALLADILGEENVVLK